MNSSSLQNKDAVEEPVSEMNSESAFNHTKLWKILLEYEILQNVDDVICLLLEDESSVNPLGHTEFVKLILLLTFDKSPIHHITVSGIFAELLSKNVLSTTAISQGVGAALKVGKRGMRFSFFSYIAAVIAPLLKTQSALFDFNDLIDCCASIDPDNYGTFFTRVINNVFSSKETEDIEDELIKTISSSLKKISYDNIYWTEKTVDSIFEKAIKNQRFASICSILCSAMQSINVVSKDGKKVLFKKLIVSKCQCLFEEDFQTQEMDSEKKLTEINLCKDPEKKKKLELEVEENERKLRTHSIRNCLFIGELFKQRILTPNIILYCIVNLVSKHHEVPLECLCILLKNVGKKLEQSYDLHDIFDKLKVLASNNMKSMIPSRIKIMIQEVIHLRKNKWIPRSPIVWRKLKLMQ